MANQPVPPGGSSDGSEPTKPTFDYNVHLQEKEERRKNLLSMNPETKMVSHSGVNHITVRL